MSRALLIVDIQHDFFPGGASPLHEPEAAARVAGQVLEAFRDSAEPIFHVQHLSDAPGAPLLVAGTPGAEIYPAVAPEGAEPVITKHSPDAFLSTTLEAQLRAAGTSTIVIVGMAADTSIEETVKAASDLGFAVTLVEDGCALPSGVDLAESEHAKLVLSHELI